MNKQEFKKARHEYRSAVRADKAENEARHRAYLRDREYDDFGYTRTTRDMIDWPVSTREYAFISQFKPRDRLAIRSKDLGVNNTRRLQRGPKASAFFDVSKNGWRMDLNKRVAIRATLKDIAAYEKSRLAA